HALGFIEDPAGRFSLCNQSGRDLSVFLRGFLPQLGNDASTIISKVRFERLHEVGAELVTQRWLCGLCLAWFHDSLSLLNPSNSAFMALSEATSPLIVRSSATTGRSCSMSIS